MRSKRFLVCLLLAFTALPDSAQTPPSGPTLSTAAGNGFLGYDGNTGSGPGGPILFSGISGIARDAAGNWILSDYGNHRLRMLNPDFSSAQTLVGTGLAGTPPSNGPVSTPPLNTPLSGPAGIAVAADRSIYFYDRATIRKYDPVARSLTLIAGTGFSTASPGPALTSFAALVNSIALHPDGRLFYSLPYFTTSNQGRVKVIQNGISTDLTPNETNRSFDGVPVMTLTPDGRMFVFDSATKIVFRVNLTDGTRQQVATLAAAGAQTGSSLVSDGADILYLADPGAHRVFRVPVNGGPVTSLAGTGLAGQSGLGGLATQAQLDSPYALYFDSPSKRLYIGEVNSSRLLYVDGATGNLQLAMGGSKRGFSGDDQPAPATAVQSRIGNILGIAAAPDGSLYLCEGNRIRKLTPAGGLTTAVGLDGGATQALETPVNTCRGMTVDSGGNLYYYEFDDRIKRVDAASGRVTVFAGGGRNASLSPMKATDVQFNGGFGAMAADRAGNIYLADTVVNAIRRITPSGDVTTVAGTGGRGGGFGGSGPGTTVPVAGPWTMTMAPNGTLYFSTNSSVIQALAPDGTVRHIGGSTVATAGGDNGPATQATFERIEGLAADSQGRLFVAHGNMVRVIGTDGVVTRLSGATMAGFAGDGGPAANGLFNSVFGLAVTTGDNLFICDFRNLRLRRIGAPQAASLSIVSGNGQVLDFGEVSKPLVVEARTAANTPAQGAAVSFSGVAGGSLRTDAQGRASVTFSAGSQPVRGRVVVATAGAPGVDFQYSVIAPLAIASVTNALDDSQAFAPGSLALVTLANLKSGVTGVEFRVNGQSAQSTAGAGDSQALVVLPDGTDPGDVQLTAVEPGRAAEANAMIGASAVAPVLQQQDGRAAFRNANGDLITGDAPAAPGESVAIILTGAGKLDDPTNPEAVPVAGVRVQIDGVDAKVELFRTADAGLVLLRFSVPDSLDGSPLERPVQITVGDATVQAQLWTGKK